MSDLVDLERFHTKCRCSACQAAGFRERTSQCAKAPADKTKPHLEEVISTLNVPESGYNQLRII